MKKIIAAVLTLISIAVTELYCKQYVDKAQPANKEIRQSPHTNAKIEKLTG